MVGREAIEADVAELLAELLDALDHIAEDSQLFAETWSKHRETLRGILQRITDQVDSDAL